MKRCICASIANSVLRSLDKPRPLDCRNGERVRGHRRAEQTSTLKHHSIESCSVAHRPPMVSLRFGQLVSFSARPHMGPMSHKVHSVKSRPARVPNVLNFARYARVRHPVDLGLVLLRRNHGLSFGRPSAG